MKRYRLLDAAITATTLLAAFGTNFLLLQYFNIRTVTPMIFVLGVFLISWITRGYFWGIAASLVSVLAVNYAFTYPYYAFDLINPECLSAAVVMLIVSVMTCTLTTKLKQQEKMKAEAEKERMRATLLRAVSHDLRTPLTSIYGACSALRDDLERIPKERQEKLLEEIAGDAQWLVRMVENLLSVTRMDGGNVRIFTVTTAVDELLDSALVKFQKRYPQQKVLLDLPQEPVLISIDCMLLEQVIINLLENAVQHARGLTQILLRVRLQEKMVVFEVVDDGCGIPADRLPQLFAGYFAPGEQPVDGGKRNAGIGLSLCATIIHAHGGSIDAENNPSGGATFRFSLQMEDITDE